MVFVPRVHASHLNDLLRKKISKKLKIDHTRQNASSLESIKTSLKIFAIQDYIPIQ